MRSCGRTGETKYKDSNVDGTNPCAEQTLEDGETCCLAEIFLPNIKTIEEFQLCVKYLYRVCKHSLTLPCHWEITNDVVHKNMRMGISITGVCQAMDKLDWLSPTYEMLREYDFKYSKEHNYPPSIKLTTIKPSGTLSLLGGCTPGVHPAYSQYYIRRVRFSSENRLVDLLEKHNYKTEYSRNFDGTDDLSTIIVEFPMQVPNGTILAENTTAVDQLELVKKLQTVWSDNSVSVTITYRLEELPEIRKWLSQNFNEHIKSVSFLLHHGHGFAQAPLEPISSEEFEKRTAELLVIDENEWTGDLEDDDLVGDLECSNGACPVR